MARTAASGCRSMFPPNGNVTPLEGFGWLFSDMAVAPGNAPVPERNFSRKAAYFRSIAGSSPVGGLPVKFSPCVLRSFVVLSFLMAPMAPAAEAPKVAFEKYMLPNGLQVILHVDKKLPIVH